jgi:hypothetical protein
MYPMMGAAGNNQVMMPMQFGGNRTTGSPFWDDMAQSVYYAGDAALFLALLIVTGRLAEYTYKDVYIPLRHGIGGIRVANILRKGNENALCEAYAAGRVTLEFERRAAALVAASKDPEVMRAMETLTTGENTRKFLKKELHANPLYNTTLDGQELKDLDRADQYLLANRIASDIEKKATHELRDSPFAVFQTTTLVAGKNVSQRNSTLFESSAAQVCENSEVVCVSQIDLEESLLDLALTTTDTDDFSSKLFEYIDLRSVEKISRAQQLKTLGRAISNTSNLTKFKSLDELIEYSTESFAISAESLSQNLFEASGATSEHSQIETLEDTKPAEQLMRNLAVALNLDPEPGPSPTELQKAQADLSVTPQEFEKIRKEFLQKTSVARDERNIQVRQKLAQMASSEAAMAIQKAVDHRLQFEVSTAAESIKVARKNAKTATELESFSNIIREALPSLQKDLLNPNLDAELLSAETLSGSLMRELRAERAFDELNGNALDRLTQNRRDGEIQDAFYRVNKEAYTLAEDEVLERFNAANISENVKALSAESAPNTVQQLYRSATESSRQIGEEKFVTTLNQMQNTGLLAGTDSIRRLHVLSQLEVSAPKVYAQVCAFENLETFLNLHQTDASMFTKFILDEAKSLNTTLPNHLTELLASTDDIEYFRNPDPKTFDSRVGEIVTAFATFEKVFGAEAAEEVYAPRAGVSRDSALKAIMQEAYKSCSPIISAAVKSQVDKLTHEKVDVQKKRVGGINFDASSRAEVFDYIARQGAKAGVFRGESYLRDKHGKVSYKTSQVMDLLKLNARDLVDARLQMAGTKFTSATRMTARTYALKNPDIAAEAISAAMHEYLDMKRNNHQCLEEACKNGNLTNAKRQKLEEQLAAAESKRLHKEVYAFGNLKLSMGEVLDNFIKPMLQHAQVETQDDRRKIFDALKKKCRNGDISVEQYIKFRKLGAYSTETLKVVEGDLQLNKTAIAVNHILAKNNVNGLDEFVQDTEVIEYSRKITDEAINTAVGRKICGVNLAGHSASNRVNQAIRPSALQVIEALHRAKNSQLGAVQSKATRIRLTQHAQYVHDIKPTQQSNGAQTQAQQNFSSGLNQAASQNRNKRPSSKRR